MTTKQVYQLATALKISFFFLLFLSLDPHQVTQSYPILCTSFGVLCDSVWFFVLALVFCSTFTVWVNSICHDKMIHLFFPSLIFLLIPVHCVALVQGQKTQANACEGRRAKAGGEQGEGHRASFFMWKWAVRPSQAQTCNFTHGNVATDILILCYMPCRLVLTAIFSLSVITKPGLGDWAIMWFTMNIKNSKRKLSQRSDIKCGYRPKT